MQQKFYVNNWLIYSYGLGVRIASKSLKQYLEMNVFYMCVASSLELLLMISDKARAAAAKYKLLLEIVKQIKDVYEVISIDTLLMKRTNSEVSKIILKCHLSVKLLFLTLLCLF